MYPFHPLQWWIGINPVDRDLSGIFRFAGVSFIKSTSVEEKDLSEVLFRL
jgi:hypothetical protein